MTAERCVVAEYDVLHDLLTRPDRLEEIPEVQPQIIVVVAMPGLRIRSRFLPRFGVMFVVPMFEVCVSQARRQSITVVARREVNPGLRRVCQRELGELEDALRAHKPSYFRRFRS